MPGENNSPPGYQGWLLVTVAESTVSAGAIDSLTTSARRDESVTLENFRSGVTPLVQGHPVDRHASSFVVDGAQGAISVRYLPGEPVPNLVASTPKSH